MKELRSFFEWIFLVILGGTLGAFVVNGLYFLFKWLAGYHSVHLTCGILRHFQAFFWLRVFPASKHCPRPPTRR